MVYCPMRAQNMGFTLLIMVLFPKVTSDGIRLLETDKAIIANNFISSKTFLENTIPPISSF